MALVIMAFGLFIGLLIDNWAPAAFGAFIAIGLIWAENKFLHQHMHQLYEGEEDEHGVKTID